MINKLKLMLKHLHIIFISLIYHLYIYISSMYHRCTCILSLYIYIFIYRMYPTFIHHLYSMSKWDIWYYLSYSENTVMMCIDTLHVLPVRMRCVWSVCDILHLGGRRCALPPNPPPAFSSQAKPFLGPAPHAVSTTAGNENQGETMKTNVSIIPILHLCIICIAVSMIYMILRFI